jgi:peptidoglycan/xylan/chitin deacetylase (PgdA/CDA1 family)
MGNSDPGAAGDRLAILTYHSLDTSGSVVSVAPGDFAAHMSCLADLGFRGVTVREAVAHRQAHGGWPQRSVVLTFDDGYVNFHEAALPTLLRHAFRATLFLVSGHVGRRNDWRPPPAGLGTRPMLSWAEVAEAAAAGMEIGAHTRTHPDLRSLDTNEAQEQIAGSRADIESRIGTQVESFAYPFGHGAWPDIVRREFKAACTTVLRRAAHEELHCLPRIDAYYVRSPRRLTHLLSGNLDGWLAIRRWARAVRARAAAA